MPTDSRIVRILTAARGLGPGLGVPLSQEVCALSVSALRPRSIGVHTDVCIQARVPGMCTHRFQTGPNKRPERRVQGLYCPSPAVNQSGIQCSLTPIQPIKHQKTTHVFSCELPSAFARSGLPAAHDQPKMSVQMAKAYISIGIGVGIAVPFAALETGWNKAKRQSYKTDRCRRGAMQLPWAVRLEQRVREVTMIPPKGLWNEGKAADGRNMDSRYSFVAVVFDASRTLPPMMLLCGCMGVGPSAK